MKIPNKTPKHQTKRMMSLQNETTGWAKYSLSKYKKKREPQLPPPSP